MRHAMLALATASLLLLSCDDGGVEVFAEYPLNNLDHIVARSNVNFDENVSSDGNGAVRIEVDSATTIPLIELADPGIENATLGYEAKIRTENLQGLVYLEMLCYFAGRGEFFARDLETPITGDVDWTIEQTEFFLRAGENPDRIRLNIRLTGGGTVWVDEIRLIKGPLR